MRYILLIYENENVNARMTDEERETMFAGYRAFTEEVRNDGVYLGGDPLLGVDTATTVRVADGKAVNTDGPFAETKEQLGGYYMLDCETLDAALAYAAKIPTAKTGSIEVRPIMDFD